MGIAAAATLVACGDVNEQPRADARVPDAETCVPESDQAFCARQASGNACEVHAGLDNCGVQRDADCGACTAGSGCVAGACKTPVCTTFAYTQSAFVADFTRAGLEDSLAAVTSNGQVLVVLQAPTGTPGGCFSFRVMIADETSPGAGTYTSLDATPVLQNHQLYTHQEGHAITADGLTLIAQSSDRKRWLTTTRSAVKLVDFGTPSDLDFALINAQIAAADATLRAPVISDDGLEFIYKVESSDADLRGTYASVRASAAVPFPAGTKQGPPVADYEFPTALSSDRLTLFMFDSFRGRALTRTSTSQPFTNPNADGDPPQISAWHHKPLADCRTLLAMSSGGGCQNEDVVRLVRE